MIKLLLSFSLLFINSVTVYCLTLSDIRTEIRRNINDNPTDTTRRRYTDAVLLDYINEAQRDINNTTWLAEKTTSYILAQGVTYYALPNDLLAIKQVHFKNTAGQTLDLEEYSRNQLYEKIPTWERQTGTPVRYWVSYNTSPVISAASTLNISYMPIPTNTSTGTVTIWYVNSVTDLSSDSDTPFEGRRYLTPYHMSIAYGATYRIKIIEGKNDEAVVYQSMYTNYINLIRNRIGQMPNYNPSFSAGKP